MDVIEYLETYCEEVTPREFYRDMFPEGELEAAGQYERDALALFRTASHRFLSQRRIGR